MDPIAKRLNDMGNDVDAGYLRDCLYHLDSDRCVSIADDIEDAKLAKTIYIEAKFRKSHPGKEWGKSGRKTVANRWFGS